MKNRNMLWKLVHKLKYVSNCHHSSTHITDICPVVRDDREYYSVVCDICKKDCGICGVYKYPWMIRIEQSLFILKKRLVRSLKT